MYKTYDKRLNNLKQRLNIASNTTPQIVMITPNKDNNYKWQIAETYYKPNKTSRVNKKYVNDYQEYLNTLKDTTATIIIDDLDLCN